jgi:hypothetical protein
MSEIPRQEEQIEEKVEVKKPAVLYHASQDKDVKEFEPRAETFRDEKEGPVVFATPDKRFASMFLVPKTTDSWCQKSVFTDPENGKSIHVMIISDKEKFEKLDKGGAIYSLPSDTFQTDLTKSTKSREWTSREVVEPTDKTEYKSGLQAMIENGVMVYFIDQQTFEKLKKSDDFGLSILQTLKPEEIKKEK